jgi:hypothetical protein
LRSSGVASLLAMTDLAMLALTVVFFLLAWLYVRACEEL